MTEATAAPAAQTLGFKAEVRELLKLPRSPRASPWASG
jgi:hypothetical protein